MNNNVSRFCRRCGKVLKNEESKLLGFGPCCYLKYVNSRKSGFMSKATAESGKKENTNEQTN